MARVVHLLVLACMLGSFISLGVSSAQETERTLRPQTQTVSGSAFQSVKPYETLQSDAIEPDTLNSVVETDPTAAPAPFTYLMLRWRATAAPGAISLEVRVSEDGEGWSAWGNVSENDDLHDPADPPDLHWSDVIYTGVARSWQLRATYQGISSVLHEVQVDTIDVRGGDGVAQEGGQLTAAQTGQALSRPEFVSRASWGGSSVLNHSTAPTWSKATHVVLHHTADANDLVRAETSWADRVRAIWAFHRYTRNWGDIGYNWLIDPNGVVYEGRNGSANLDQDAVGIHDTANTGSMGVALIGTFGEGGRYRPIMPSDAAQDALVRLLTWKAYQRTIDPVGSSYYAGCARSSYCRASHPDAIVENITGHRDVAPGETSCPGDLAAGLLPAIRGRVSDALRTTRLDAATPEPGTGSPDSDPSITPDLPPTNTPTPPSTPTSTPSPTATLPPTPTATPRPFTRIEGSVHWSLADSPIILDQDQRIVAGAVLLIDPGVEVRLASEVDLHVEGGLSALGTAESPIRFVGSGGRWGAVIGHEGSTIILEHTELHAAGASGTALGGVGGQMRLDHVLLTDGGGGISVEGTALEIRNSTISGNQLERGPALSVALRPQVPLAVYDSIFGGNQMPLGMTQVRLIGGQGATSFDLQRNVFSGDVGPLLELRTSSALGGTIRCNSFKSGSIGLQLSSSTPSATGFTLAVDSNAFDGQSQYGVASTIALDAGNNWWGDPSGPADVVRNPDGRGPRIGIHVAYTPVLTTRPDCAPAP